MHITIYGKPGCIYCEKAINLASKLFDLCHNVDYEYKIMTEFDKHYLNVKYRLKITRVPQIIIDGQHIGGYYDFEQYIRKFYDCDINQLSAELSATDFSAEF